MIVNDPDSIPTRQSLLARLKDWEDQESWREFFDTYWRLIHATAFKAGLNEAEAQEVVQEVMLAAAKKMPSFTYEPGKDSLKGWLLAVTRWKVADQFRKRDPNAESRGDTGASIARGRAASGEEGTARTATVDRVPDPHQIDAVWDSEWRENLLRVALDRVKVRVNPAHYEMYHLHVVQGLSARETARALDTSAAAVHLAKHRVGRLVKAELKRLQVEER
jgi:RNA polymerase sigma-70 factor (ECF subfamily)